jgi:predicted 3-demethylubiquinone-9 3-methyltransferase (glyoxalase superfamily)
MAAFDDTRECYGERSIVLQEGEFSVNHLKQKITTFLMFDGKAEEAMNYYVSVFDQAEIVSIHRYGANEVGAEGTVVHATLSLCGQVFMCMDSNVKHDFTFTPAISLYVACATEEEIDRLFEKLSQGGAVAMPLTAYPFSDKFAWVADKYGVSWQLNLERN